MPAMAACSHCTLSAGRAVHSPPVASFRKQLMAPGTAAAGGQARYMYGPTRSAWPCQLSIGGAVRAAAHNVHWQQHRLWPAVASVCGRQWLRFVVRSCVCLCLAVGSVCRRVCGWQWVLCVVGWHFWILPHWASVPAVHALRKICWSQCP